MFIEPQISSTWCVPESGLSLSHLLGFCFPVSGFGKKTKQKIPPAPSPPQKKLRVELESICFFLRQRRICCVSTKYTCYGKSVCVKLYGFSVPLGVY